MLEITRKQAEFVQSEAYGTIFQGGVGTGKTHIHAHIAIDYGARGMNYGLIGRNYPMIKDSILPAIKSVLNQRGFIKDVHYEYLKSDKEFNFKSGGQILIKSGDDPDSLRGMNLHAGGIDEARQFKDDYIYDMLIQRLRLGEFPQWYMSTTTRGKNWVYELGKQEDVKVIVQRTSENPFIPKSYERNLREKYSSDFASQELDAAIVDFSAGVMRRAWFVIDDLSSAQIDERRWARSWDLAFTKKLSNDASAGALVGLFDNIPHLYDMKHFRNSYQDTKRAIIECAKTDGFEVPILIECNGTQRGYFDDIRGDQELRNHKIVGIFPKGDKTSRAMPWVAKLEQGLFTMNKGSWNEKFIDECTQFTIDDSHLHDDMIDAVSQAYNHLFKSRAAKRVRNMTMGF